MGAGSIGDIAQRLIDGGRRRRHARRRGAQRHAPRPAHGAGHARDHRRRRRAGTERDRGRRGRRARPRVVRDRGRCSAARSWSRARASRRASCAARLEALGAEVIELPAIAIEPLDFAVPDLAGYAWLVFTSVNGVDAFFDRGLEPAGLDARALAGVRVAAIGPGTDARARPARHPRRPRCPSGSSPSRCSTRSPTPAAPASGCCSPAPSRRRDVLPEGLGARGYAVDVLPVYRTVPADARPGGARARARRATSTRSRSRRRRPSTTSATCSARSPTRSRSWCRSARSRRRPPRTAASASTPRPTEHTIDGLVAALLARFGVG